MEKYTLTKEQLETIVKTKTKPLTDKIKELEEKQSNTIYVETNTPPVGAGQTSTTIEKLIEGLEI